MQAFLAPTLYGTLSIDDLRADLRGRVIAPGDAEYEEARQVYSAHIDRRPAVIVRTADAAEVAHVIAIARETGLERAVRSGGHSGPGFGTTDGGIVLELSGLKGVAIDVERRTVWAGAGVRQPAIRERMTDVEPNRYGVARRRYGAARASRPANQP